ncbi:BMP family ABC transporter substrate-binding protein [Halalkalibacillus sediminis]|uniref:BMP family ABC transporter substrate-binding protein n=1 Tax=Halalkalibacillus sediminis TaxID=2018042 RepID=A0A2I0QVG4_9BACI|nr:BMP family ABC transporter substrate-binding protein [Halalkalibacillus sediminis]PKR78337.1 BMP family ABC transporter substrate-binding protein [Halalkalibacillus sediminis]
MKNLAVVLLAALLLSGCNEWFDRGQLENVGLILEGTIHDETWGQGAYLGLLNIKEEENVSVLFRENIVGSRSTDEVVEDFDRQGVNLIFGHGSKFGAYFNDLNEYYPDIHFVYFNGNNFGRNITSLQFEGYEMGYFAGVMAGETTETDHLGILAAFPNQPEVEGFFEGVKSVDRSLKVTIKYVNDWYDQQRAMMFFQQMVEQDVDVVYPAGDGFNVPIIHEASKLGIHAIGYINDQKEIDPDTVITSTVQDLENLYLDIAQKYDKNELPTGIMRIGFEDEFVYLGSYGDDVPVRVQDHVNELIEKYIETGQLPK